MILENGEWMNIEDTESLEIKKLRWKAAMNIQGNRLTITNSETIARLSTDSHYGPLWAELITKGVIKPEIEMVAALIKAGHLSPDSKFELAVPFEIPEERTHEEKNAPPPPCHSTSRAWLWLLALPVVAGVWFAVRLRRKKN